MRLSVAAYNRDGDLVLDTQALTEKATGLRFSSVLPGGYQQCEFNVPSALRKEMHLKCAYRIAVRNGIQSCWEGRIAESVRGMSSGRVLAFGLWEHLNQRRASYDATFVDTASSVIRYVLRQNSPLVGGTFMHVQNPYLVLPGMSWDRASLQKIILDVAAAGDNSVPPRTWYFAVWDSMEKDPDSRYDAQVAASADDAHDTATNDDNTFNANYFTVGKDAINPAVVYSAGLRFTNLEIPRYAHIRSAKVYMRSVFDVPEQLHLLFYADASGNSLNFEEYDIDGGGWPKYRVPTYEYAAWNPLLLENGIWYNVDVKDCVQEVIDRNDWMGGNALSILIRDNDSPTLGYFATQDEGAGDQARLEIEWGASAETSMRFPPYFFPREVPSRANTDYLLFTSDIEPGFELVQTTDGLYNSVVAKYANSEYTSSAEDAESIAMYDKRENDPGSLDAGSSASLLAAQNLRDAFLEKHKMPQWNANTITVRRLRTRYGHHVYPETVRAGSIVRIVDLPTFDPDKESCFYITQTEYDADSDRLTLWPDIPVTASGMLGESVEDIEQGPFFALGIIQNFIKETYLADVTVGGTTLVNVPVAHEIGWWLLPENALCVVMFNGIYQKAENALVVAMYGGKAPDDIRFDPAYGHKHTGALQDGGYQL